MSEERKYYQDSLGVGGVISGGIKANSPSVERDPDSVEQLLAQVLNQAHDINAALYSTRNELLGSWPQNAEVSPLKGNPDGLVPKVKTALYSIMDIQREIREHVVAISKGVR